MPAGIGFSVSAQTEERNTGASHPGRRPMLPLWLQRPGYILEVGEPSASSRRLSRMASSPLGWRRVS
jgi:hypothetical protein